MKIKFYKVWISRHGETLGVPNTLTLTASYWRTAALAHSHYGFQFVKLSEDEYIERDYAEDLS